MTQSFPYHKAKKGEFKSFDVPMDPQKDTPIAIPNGLLYKCRGCGGPIPAGMWILEKIRDNKIVGLKMKFGDDGQVVHECGEVVD